MARPLSPIFVAGAHTDVGKTHVACALLYVARRRRLMVDAFKPVVSGFTPGGAALSDPGRLLSAMDRAATPAAIAAVSPLRFTAALAPPMAARLEGVALELAAVTASCRTWLAGTHADLRLIEGVGGLMSPLTEDATGLDLMLDLALPSVLVGGSYLGGISHLLTALEVMRARALPVVAVVISESEGDTPDFAQTLDAVRRFAGEVAVIGAPRTGAVDWADEVLARITPISAPGA